MTDPVTIGALAASALAMAMEAAVKGVSGHGAKDAYDALKSKVAKWAKNDVTALEQTPDSAARKAVIAEIIDQVAEPEKEIVKALAERLINSLKDIDKTAVRSTNIIAQNIKAGNNSINTQAGGDATIINK
ncbi:hypothetical protein [Methylocystis sp.]|jgi:hypothetical protein|uniref:hypothetical protein n=1 Tax=Methylocystis sp. TaxID=1911079 RepID=UPI003DA2C778